MTIVMGLDQHRAQITTEWIDSDTGELGRFDVERDHDDLECRRRRTQDLSENECRIDDRA